VLVTTRLLYKRKVAPIRDQLPNLKHILLIDGEDERSGLLDLGKLMDAASEDFEVVATDPEDLALLHFTSGTTGKPKGAMHVHQAVVAITIPAARRSTCTRTTSSGARRIRAG
jgi:acetyl-CoA synthetase